MIITYYCGSIESSNQQIKYSSEHKELGLFPIEEIDALNMPEGYKRSVRRVGEAFI